MGKKLSFRERFQAQLDKCQDELDDLDQKSRVFEETLKSKFKEKEPEFRGLIQEGKLSLQELEKMTDAEVDKIKGSLEFTSHALKSSIDVFVEQFRARQEEKKRDED